MSKEKKIRRDILNLRKRAKKHGAITRSSREQADELEKPFLLQDAKKMYEGKCYAPSMNEWICCEEVIKAERMFADRIDVTSKVIRIIKSEDGYFCISKHEIDLSQVYFKNEMLKKYFMKVFQKAVLNLTPKNINNNV